MDIFNIQSLIKQGRLVKATDIDPNQTYLQIGVYQKGNRENNASNANTYESYAIELSEISGGSGLIIVTKAELDVLINTNTLVAGAFYKVLGVDTPLYGGTDIIVQAVSTNKISDDGVGFFYNPDYSQYSIYNPYIRVITSNIIGEFNFNENVINDLGGKGTIVGNFKPAGGSIGYINFDYPSNIDIATTLSGQVTGATIDFTIDVLPDFTLGTKVIWGGRVWVNINGTRGSIIDPYTLSPQEWEPVPYNNTDYNYVMDPIKYEYDNDFLSYRAETDADNTVLATFTDTIAFQSTTGIAYFVNAIKAFQWGNQYSFTTATGTLSNHVKNSYFECINFKAQVMVGTNLIQYSTIYNIDTVGLNTFDINIFDSQTTFNNVFLIDSTIRFNKFEANSYLNGLIIQSSVIDFNYGFASDMYSINLLDSGITQNYLNDSFFSNLNFINGTLYENNLIQGSFISNINLRDSSLIAWSILTAQSSIAFNTLTLNAQVFYNTLSNYSSITNNTINGTFIVKNVLKSSNIGGNTFDAGALTENTLMSSFIQNNVLDNTQVSYNTLDGDCNISYNDFQSIALNYNKLSILSAINNNNIIASSVNQNTLINQASITNCVISGTSEISFNFIKTNSLIRIIGGVGTQINYNTVSNFSSIEESISATQAPVIIYNVVDKQSYIRGNTWASTGSITNNNLSNSEINANIIDTGAINYCSLSNNSFIINNLINNSSYIEHCSLDLSTINGCDIGVNNGMINYILQNSTIVGWGISLVTGVTSPKTTFINITVSSLSTFPSTGIFQGMTEYADNAAALAGGLQVGQLYRITGTGSVQIVI